MVVQYELLDFLDFFANRLEKYVVDPITSFLGMDYYIEIDPISVLVFFGVLLIGLLCYFFLWVIAKADRITIKEAIKTNDGKLIVAVWIIGVIRIICLGAPFIVIGVIIWLIWGAFSSLTGIGKW